MAAVYPMFSSSKGNCIYFGDKDEGIIIDCGVSCRQICTALSENGLSPTAVKGIFITHTHSDHVKGLKVFAGKYSIPVFAFEKNLDKLSASGNLPENCGCCMIDGCTSTAGGFTVEYFPTKHDEPPSCGYRVTYPDGKTAVLCTDLGIVTEEVKNGVMGADIILIESNYDSDMLYYGPYPSYLKDRIFSDYGHLSNEDCGEFLFELYRNGTRNFILGHLSQENNKPEAAQESAENFLSPLKNGVDYQLYVAPPSKGRAVIF